MSEKIGNIWAKVADQYYTLRAEELKELVKSSFQDKPQNTDVDVRKLVNTKGIYSHKVLEYLAERVDRSCTLRDEDYFHLIVAQTENMFFHLKVNSGQKLSLKIVKRFKDDQVDEESITRIVNLILGWLWKQITSS